MADSMPGRWFHKTMLAAAVLWFGMVLPGHERGAIRVPGAQSKSADTTACERTCCHRTSSNPDERGIPESPIDSGGDCAVCHLIGTLDTPTPPILAPVQADLIALVATAPTRSVATIESPFRHSGRAPPLLT